MSDVQNSPSKKRSQTNTTIKRQRVQEDELSLDTRLAAQAILNDEVIGRTTETVVPRGPSPVVEWLSQRQVMLTVISVLLCSSLAIIPVLMKTQQRASTEGIRQVLQVQASKLGEAFGVDRMSKLIQKKEVRALQDFYTQQRPMVVQAFVDNGFAIDSQDIRIRIDDEKRTLVLGVRFTNAELGHRLYWANLTGGYDGRGAPSAELSSVLEADKGSILLCIVVELILLAIVWGLPYLSSRRQVSSTL